MGVNCLVYEYSFIGLVLRGFWVIRSFKLYFKVWWERNRVYEDLGAFERYSEF